MKTDMAGVRTAQDLERKYNLGDLETVREITYKNSDTLVHVNNELNDFISTTTDTLEDLQEQIDGEITTWFYNGTPTLNNEPAVNWTTVEEKNRHLGDLYYDQSTGYAYRFVVNSNVYSWLQLSDSAVAEALALASAAQDTADNKRRVFMAQPTPPYDRGDLWINNNEIYICNVARTDAETYQNNDFIHNLKYTDDTTADIANGKADTINLTQVIKSDSNGNLKLATIATDPSQGTAFSVKADDINFQGKNFNLTTSNMTISSTNFSVDNNGNMTCNNATVNGNLVTANGVLSNLVFPCEHWGWDQENAYNGVGGWFLGFNYLFDNSYNPYAIKSFLNFSINLPANFIVTSAKIYLRHTPVTWYPGASDFDTSMYYNVGDYCIYNGYLYRCTTSHHGNWNSSHFTQVAADHITGYCRNVKIYEASGLGQTAEAGYYSEYTIGGTTPSLTQVTTDNLTFSSSAFEQKATSDFSSIFTTSTSPQTHNVVVWTDVTTPSITSGETAYNDIGKYTGLMTGYAQIIGYLKA